MTTQGGMVQRLRPLVELHRGRRQAPVSFRPATWRSRLDSHQVAHVLRLDAEDPASRGDRLISRDDLAALQLATGDNPDRLRELFVVVMIWGSGKTNGRGPRYTSDALDDPRLRSVLETTRMAVRSGDLRRAYDQFTVRGVGRSFFTKWFAAVDDPDATRERALILDDRALRSLNALGWSSKESASSRRWPHRYAIYVRAMHDWAEPLEVSADWLEWLMFDLNGRVDAP